MNVKHALKSLQYRDRITLSTADKETQLMSFVTACGGEATIGGYLVRLDGVQLSWEKLEQLPENQLAFPFMESQNTTTKEMSKV